MILTMTTLSDWQLLRRYCDSSDREALDELVRRHIGFVYAAAVRQTRDPHMAEDVTQAVFIVLARRGGSVRSDAALPGWLFSVTRFAAASARRLERRRAHHERLAAQGSPTMTHDRDPARDQLLAHLDDAIAELSEADRRSVLLSYFHDMTFRQVGSAMGISEEAARKRVARAVERMREYFSRRGATVTGAGLASIMVSESAVAAPMHLLAPASNVALIANSFTSQAIVRGVGKMLMWSALKPLAAAAAVVVIVSGVVVAQVARQQDAPDAPAAQLAAAQASFVVDLGDGIEVDFVAIAPVGAREWHSPAGKPVPRERIDELLAELGNATVILHPEATHRALVRVKAPADVDVDLQVANAPASGAAHGNTDDGSRVLVAHFVAPADGKPVDLEVSLATGPWQQVVDNDNHDSNFQGMWGVRDGGVAFTPMIESDGRCTIFVATEMTKRPWRVVAFDDADNVIGTHRGNETSAGNLSTCQAEFETPRATIRRIEVQTRPYDKHASCRDCTLDAEKPKAATVSDK